MASNPVAIGGLPARGLTPRAREVTSGQFRTEEESTRALDLALQQADLWTVYKEVPGSLIQPRPAQEGISLRIDRVLVPNRKLLDKGWLHGNIGIEAKKSGVKIGPVIAQAIDYSRALWTLPVGGIRTYLDWIFIWPMEAPYGTVESILAQNRIGAAFCRSYMHIQLKSGQNIIRVHIDGSVTIGEGENGKRSGSR